MTLFVIVVAEIERQVQELQAKRKAIQETETEPGEPVQRVRRDEGRCASSEGECV